MFKPKAYKSMLAASVLTAVMGTGSVFAAEVQAGYTPDLNSTTTTNTIKTIAAIDKPSIDCSLMMRKYKKSLSN